MTRWEDREPDLSGVSEEIGRLLSRARRTLAATLGITLLIAGAFTARELRKQRFYSSTIVLTATEGEHAEDAVAHTAARFEDHVYHAVFTDSVLTELMKKYDFRPDLQEKNPRFALELFRDLIDVDVYKNEFTAPRYPESPPRSARIAVNVRYTDPDQALALVRDLGELVIKRDADIRKERFTAKLQVATDVVNTTKAELDRLSNEAEFARAAEETIPERRGEFKVQADGAERGLVAAIARLKEAEAERNKLDFSKSADKESLELRYDKADWGVPERRENRTLLLIRTALFSFFGLLPIVALTVGAFNPRVYDERDVSRLGLKSLGRVRSSRQA
ncbi:MAG: hypothetical protein HOW73_36785 [Polyangiaceae bacterium]|nr:hypothetical protein [Polyangiaceae bacterium]